MFWQISWDIGKSLDFIRKLPYKFLVLIVLGAVFILIMEFTNPKTLGPIPIGTKVLASFFQSVSPRTAGFNTINLAGMYDLTLLSMIVLMFIGANGNTVCCR